MNNRGNLLIIISALLISLPACSEQPEENKMQTDNIENKASVKKPLMSQETTLSAAENITAEIKIPTAVCNKCEKNIVAGIKKLDGIVKVSADAEKKNVIVTFNGAKITTEKIRYAISKAGYDADDVKRDPAAYEKLEDCCKKQ